MSWLFAGVLATGFSLASPPVPAGPSVVPVTPKKKRVTGIEWKVTPGSVEIFVDGKRLGTAKELGRTRHRPGRHTIVLKRRGDEEEFEVKLLKGQTVRLEYSFGD